LMIGVGPPATASLIAASLWKPYEQWTGRKNGIAMSTIEEVRAAEKRVQKELDALKKAPAEDPNRLADELKKATDEYARLVSELNSK